MVDKVKKQLEKDEAALPANIEEIVKQWTGKLKNAPRAIQDQVRAYKRLQVQKRVAQIAQNKKIIKISEMDQFLEAMIKNNGNATQAVLAIHPEITSIEVAEQLGSRLMKEARGLTKIYLEKKGYGFGKFMDIALEKMLNSDKPEWWDRLMKMAAYEDFITKKQGPAVGTNINIWGAHQAQSSKYIQGEEVQEAEVVEDNK